jgi:hypothetical protein
MHHPKHRRLVLLGLLLLVSGALGLLGQQWTSPTEPVPTHSTIATKQALGSQPAKAQPPSIQAAAPNVNASTSSATPPDFRGRIIDAVTRRPIEEFEIQLIRVRRDAYTEDQPITRNFSSATGRFTWPDVAAGTWRAAISAPGYQMFNLADLQISEGETTREFVVPLLRGFAVRGRVFDLSTGGSIVGARISFRQESAFENFGKSKAYAQSKEDGSFTLDGIPAGDIVLTVGARDHASRELAVIVDEKTPPQEIALSTGATIAGIVTTTAGVPAKGRVHLDGPGPSYVHETNEAGRFFFNHMPPGQYRVSAHTSAGSAKHEFMLGQDEVEQDITLIVGAGRSVRGTLKGLQTEQLQEAQILLQSDSPGMSFTASPNELGAYAVNGVPSGHAMMMVFAADLELRKQVDVPSDRDVTVDIDFQTGGRLSGRVTQGGKPAASRKIWMRPIGNKSDVVYRAMTSADGQYNIERLPPGDYRLRAEEDISRAVNIAGDAVLNIDIPLAQLSARVVKDGGTLPIVGANVYAVGTAPETARVRGEKLTNDLGEFTLTGIESGEIVLIVYKPGYEMHRETIVYSSTMTNRTITLRKSAGVEVRVQPRSRRFPRGFTITLSFPGNVVDLWMPMDREGACHVPRALAGTTFQIGRFSGEPIVIEEWDGEPFELP